MDHVRLFLMLLVFVGFELFVGFDFMSFGVVALDLQIVFSSQSSEFPSGFVRNSPALEKDTQCMVRTISLRD